MFTNTSSAIFNRLIKTSITPDIENIDLTVDAKDGGCFCKQ